MLKIKKPVRSKAGVTVLTVVLKPRRCDHGTCIYCPGSDSESVPTPPRIFVPNSVEVSSSSCVPDMRLPSSSSVPDIGTKSCSTLGVPQSYTDKSPAIMRARALGYDVEKQVKARMRVLKEMNHPLDKIEVIILGGTFLQYDFDYQEYVIKTCYDVLNGEKSKTLEEAKTKNEGAKHRVVALCIENRPDNCSEREIKRMLSYGCTRVELGVQILDDKVYKKINRGHTVKDVVEATRRLKDAGFKVGYHVMPGLPYSNVKKDLSLFKKIFSDERFRPDQLKIYPCQIVEGSALSKNWKKIGYKPYSEDKMKKLLVEMLKVVPEYCRVMRMMREIPSEKIVNPLRTDLRKIVEDELREKGEDVKEIRMREVGLNLPSFARLGGRANLDLSIVRYKASRGDEYFLQMVDDKNILFGLLRLRLIKDKVIVRELHVYGQALEISKSLKGAHTTHLNPRHENKIQQHGNEAQHRGLGKRLMLEAEKIARENGYKKISVISGVGVREYYRKLGYELEGEYMVKGL